MLDLLHKIQRKKEHGCLVCTGNKKLMTSRKNVGFNMQFMTSKKNTGFITRRGEK